MLLGKKIELLCHYTIGSVNCVVFVKALTRRLGVIFREGMGWNAASICKSDNIEGKLSFKGVTVLNKEYHQIIKLTAGVIAMIFVLVFGPRMEGPRCINGIKIMTKTGVPGLTNLGWLLLVSAPPAVYFVTG